MEEMKKTLHCKVVQPVCTTFRIVQEAEALVLTKGQGSTLEVRSRERIFLQGRYR